LTDGLASARVYQKRLEEEAGLKLGRCARTAASWSLTAAIPNKARTNCGLHPTPADYCSSPPP